MGRFAKPSYTKSERRTKRPVGSLPPSKPPPARHRPGARSARLGDVPPFYRRPTGKGRTNHVTPQLAAEPAIRLGAGPEQGQTRATGLASSRDATAKPRSPGRPHRAELCRP